MNYDEFQQHIAEAHSTLTEFADLVRMNSVSLYNYRKKGEVPSHMAVIAVLLAEMEKRGIDYRELLSQIDITPKKPRGAGIGKFGGNKNGNSNL